MKVIDNIMPDKMKKAQVKDKDLVEVIKYMEGHDKVPSYAKIRKFKSSVVRKYVLQFDRLILIEGVLHWTCAEDEAEFHQLVLPPEFRLEVLKIFYDDQGH